jgi:hypothetical protein
MSELRKLIDQITAFGTNPNVELDNKIVVLKKLLVGIYHEYLHLQFDDYNKDYEDKTNFNYYVIRANVASNFPDFRWYSIVLDSNKMDDNIETGYGDELDDLTDIIKDLLVVQWRMDNTSLKDALWHFNFLMNHHSEQHLVDLLKRLKERDE